MSKKYNGWANYETWNVALWIGNDECMYDIARNVDSYTRFVELWIDKATPDGVSFTDDKLDLPALLKMIKELE